jgi:hypothetical protein
MITIHVLKIDNAGRVRIPTEIAPSGLSDGPLTLVPMFWKRVINLPIDRQMEAWLLYNQADAAACDDWEISPTEIQAKAKNNDVASNLASVIFNIAIENHKGAWRFTCPKLLRDLGWLPRNSEQIIVRAEQFGTSLWTETAFRLLYAGSLTKQWFDIELK